MTKKSPNNSQDDAREKTAATTANFVFVTNSTPEGPCDEMMEKTLEKSQYVQEGKVLEMSAGVPTAKGDLESQEHINSASTTTAASNGTDTDQVATGVAIPDENVADVFVPDEIQRAQSNIRASRGPGAYSLAPGRGSLFLSGRIDPRRTSAGSLLSFHSDRDRDVIATAVTDAEPVVYASDVKKEERSRFNSLFGLVLCLFVVIGLSLGLGLGLGLGNDPPTNAPPLQNVTESPWRECNAENQEVESDRRATLRSILKLEFGEDEDSPCSSHNQALTWLAEDDGFLVPETVAYLGKISQRFAVAHFFFSTNGPGWTKTFDWLSEEDECLWNGVTCDDDENVVTLNIPSTNNATGSIPSTIGSLSSLTGLIFSRNKIGGKLPREIGLLKNLEVLTASGNKISGTIPDVIGTMKSLRVFDIGGNHLTGSIPPSLYTLNNLRVIVFHGNKLNGTISSEIGKLSGIHHLMWGRNRFSGEIPSDIQNLRKMRLLDLSGNNFSGQIPSEIGLMKNLTCIGLSNNTLHGEIPQQLGNLGYLEHLRLGGNMFNTSVPDRVCYHFEHNALPGARMCEGKNLDCACCSQCEVSGRPFCMPGVELRKNTGLPPDRKPLNL